MFVSVGAEDSSLLTSSNFDEKGIKLHQVDSISLLVYVYLLIVAVLTIWLFKYRQIGFLHETGVSVVFGLIVGAIIRFGVPPSSGSNNMEVMPLPHYNFTKGIPDIIWMKLPLNFHNYTYSSNKTLTYSFLNEVRDQDYVPEIDRKATFDPEIFFNIILPPIIFHAGYSMKKRFFFRNIVSIMAFAFVGTAISAFTVGGIMYCICAIVPHLSGFTFLDSMHFGSLISSTDPVTILTIFNDIHVDVNLYALVFGESVLNDAVAIVLSRIVENYESKSSQGNASSSMAGYIVFFKVIGQFVGIFMASFLVGAITGCCTALITKFTHIKQFSLLESSLFVLMSYSTFLLAEVLDLTGIVAVLFCGICQAHYTYNNLSDASRAITKQFFDLLNFLAENFIFSYIGVSMFTYPNHKFDVVFILGSFLAIIIGRFLNVYPISFMLNFGRKSKITPNLQHMMFLTGLRGAIAFALASRNTITESRQMVLSTTMLIVIITVILGGVYTKPFLAWLNIAQGVGDDQDVAFSPYSSGEPCSPSHYESVVASDDPSTWVGGLGTRKSWLANAWSKFDDNYMKPFLTNSRPTLMETLPGFCAKFGRMLTSSEQLVKTPTTTGTIGPTSSETSTLNLDDINGN